jgi:hypothetical protein
VFPGAESSEQVEHARKQINRLADEIAQISDTDLAPGDFFGEFLLRVMTALAAPAGAVWVRTPQGNLQLQYEINARQAGLDKGPEIRQQHDELLRHATAKAQPAVVMPHSRVGPPENGVPAPGNPTDHVILLAPITNDKNLVGLLEVFQDPKRGLDAQRGFLNFMVRMTAYAAGYLRNHQLRQMVGKEQVWSQLEVFSRQIHGALNPTEVGYIVANEGRRLLEADRVSVAIRKPRTTVVAISGADIVEKRSNLVQLMRALFDSVINWGEKLVYTGTQDDALPPKVFKALDAYLAESNSKLLVIQPLLDERDTKNKTKARSALMMESFDVALDQEQQFARLEVVCRHAAPALYNAAEYERIPMRFLWMPLAKVQDGLGGKTKAIVWSVALGLIALVAALIFVPYPLKMTASGQLLPIERTYIYAPVPGQIVAFPNYMKPGAWVEKEKQLVQLYDPDLAKKINELKKEIEIETMKEKTFAAAGRPGTDESSSAAVQQQQAAITKAYKLRELEELYSKTNADHDRPGYFWVRSPIPGLVLSTDFREKLERKVVKPSEPLLRIGNANPNAPNLDRWEIELKIPQKHIGQVLKAFKPRDDNDELDVDLLLASEPTSKYKGKLKRSKVAFQAETDRDAHDEPEPIVKAWVRISGDDIPANYRIPLEALVSGTEVRTRIRCGDKAMGYSLFYGVWEFLCEKVLFALT